MRRNEPTGARTWRRCTLLLIVSLGIAGCAVPPPQQGDSNDPACGFFYSCGSDSDTNRGGEQTATGTSSGGSNGTSTSTTSDGE